MVIVKSNVVVVGGDSLVLVTQPHPESVPRIGSAPVNAMSSSLAVLHLCLSPDAARFARVRPVKALPVPPSGAHLPLYDMMYLADRDAPSRFPKSLPKRKIQQPGRDLLGRQKALLLSSGEKQAQSGRVLETRTA
jgi:hypothetical protein